MPNFSSPGIILRRFDHNDFDIIISFFTLAHGKIALIAKSAKKSLKRFQGILELFSVVDMVWSKGHGSGLPVLQEAVLVNPFSNIRKDITKTAYASYWSELIYYWLEERKRRVDVYYLFEHALAELDRGYISGEAVSVFFQMRLAVLAGLSPNFKECSVCRKNLDMMATRVILNLERGGLVCETCAVGIQSNMPLSKGTIKQLLWIQDRDSEAAKRIRLTSQAVKEGLRFMERFMPYHMGSEPRSLKFLKRIR